MRQGVAVAGLMCVLAVAACESSPSAEPSVVSSSAPGRVDPQVVQDVIENFLPVPGAESVARGRRVTNFTNNLQIYEECGGRPIPLDMVRDTNGALYPDLDLIREWGLPPIYSPSERYGLDVEDHEVGADGTDGACVARLGEADAKGRSPAPLDWDGVGKLVYSWNEDQALATRSDPRVASVRSAMAQCLRDGSGLKVADEDPSTSFLSAVDRAYFPPDSTVTVAQMKEWSVLYADCGEPYYAKVKELLEEVRPAMVERHREVIEDFAAQLVGAGYVP